MFQLLAATSNKHKIAEFRQILCDLEDQLTILSPADFPGFPEIPETGTTFEENSMQKAVQASRFAGICAFADDSGLDVDALNGAPGIFSARYAGENASDQDKIQKLLQEMIQVPPALRTARFVCVVSIAQGGKPIRSFRGEVAGHIAMAPAGIDGFGYDPVFIPDHYQQTFAQLGNAIKDKISHRAVALAGAANFLRQELKEFREIQQPGSF